MPFLYRTTLKFFSFFPQWCLNAGGHQLPLKYLIPSTVAKLTEQAFGGITKVPVCSILIRLLPHSEVCVVSSVKHNLKTIFFSFFFSCRYCCH